MPPSRASLPHLVRRRIKWQKMYKKAEVWEAIEEG